MIDQPTFQIQAEEETDSHGVYVIEPMAQGYGHTLGNALRRVLLSSLPGAAITSVKLSGVKHQFSTIDGVVEDVVDIILNLKQVRLKYSGDKPVRLSLEKRGAGKIKAGDIEFPAGVEIVNPELHIATLADDKAKLEAEMTVESGYGYSMADERKSDVVGVIPVDALFSPVTRVNYRVEATRVGRITNFDRLILEVSTDGTIEPFAAIKQSAQILVGYFNQIINPTEATESTVAAGSLAAQADGMKSEVLRLTVDELELPTRIANALRRAGIETVGDLVVTPKTEIAKMKNLGDKSLKVIELSLREKGVELPA
jgi:DNA-directed RNA polymerase subunit alpha